MDNEPRPEGGVRKRGVLCDVHGLHYNPEETTGCVLCRREAVEAEPEPPKPRRRGGVLLLLLGGAVVALLSYRSIQSYLTNGQPPAVSRSSSNQAEEEAPSGSPMLQTRVNPSRYREQITAIESILYRRSPPSLTDIGVIERAAEELSAKIGENEDGPWVGRVTADILAWSGRVGIQEESGYAIPQLGRARVEWESLRSRIFEHADWFQTAIPRELAQAQRPQVPRADPETVRALRQSVRTIVQLVDSGRLECERLPEIVGEADPNARRKLATWREWSREWERRVQRAAGGLPGGVTMGSNPNAMMAHQSLGFALNSLRLVPIAANDFGIPFYWERTQRFNEALAHIQTAEDHLRRLE